MGSIGNFLLNIISIVILGLLFYYAVNYLQHEEFINYSNNSPVTFLTAEETKKFLQDDPDEYVHTLNQWDLIARHVETFQDYINKISKAARSFSDDQKQRIQKAANDADKFFSNLSIDGIDCQEIQLIPWVIALTTEKEYEEGLPHTRADKIFISTSLNQTHESLVRILIHEKVHVYQRIFAQHMIAFIQQNGYTYWKQRSGVPRLRSNPDLDEWIYFNPQTKKPMAFYYVSDNPQNINDVDAATQGEYEHPYEEIAYKIAAKYAPK
jgi:hypothetical protein